MNEAEGCGLKYTLHEILQSDGTYSDEQRECGDCGFLCSNCTEKKYKQKVNKALDSLWNDYLFELYYPDGSHRGNPPDWEDVIKKFNEWAMNKFGIDANKIDEKELGLKDGME